MKTRSKKPAQSESDDLDFRLDEHDRLMSDPRIAYRSAVIEVRGDSDSEMVYASVSSEEPVLTWIDVNGDWMRAWEILDHAPESIDMKRCQDGLVIRDTHKGDQVALMSASAKNRKLGGPMEFCSGQRAQDIQKDAAKKLRRNLSVGYMADPTKYRIEGDINGVPLARSLRWMPYEASFEPVPADTTVGVNRAATTTTAKAVKKEMNKMTPKEFGMLYARAAKFGISADDVAAMVTDDSTYDAARAVLDAKIVEKQAEVADAQRKEIEALKTRKPDAPATAAAPSVVGAPAVVVKQERKYSLMNVLRSLSGIKTDIGMEREVSEELANQRGKPATGIIIPHAALAKRDFTVSGTSSASVSTDLMAGEFIDLLRTRSVLGAAGVRFLTGLVGNVAIPKMSAGATGYWVAEAGDITESQPTLGQVTGSPHTCGVMTDISRRLIMQSTPAAEMLVRDEIIERIIRTIQIAVFAGTGSDGQPSAITNATGINNPSINSAGTPTYAEILNFPGSIMADNAEADGQKWIMTAEVWAKLAATMRTATYGDIPVLDPTSKTCIGFPYLVTEDVPANSLWFGNWATVNVGVWGNGIDINVDTATLSSSGGVRVVGLQDVDVMVRQGYALAYNTAVTA